MGHILKIITGFTIFYFTEYHNFQFPLLDFLKYVYTQAKYDRDRNSCFVYQN